MMTKKTNPPTIYPILKFLLVKIDSLLDESEFAVVVTSIGASLGAFEKEGISDGFPVDVGLFTQNNNKY